MSQCSGTGSGMAAAGCAGVFAPAVDHSSDGGSGKNLLVRR